VLILNFGFTHILTAGLGDANRSSIDVLALELKLKNDMGERLIESEAEDSSSRSERGRNRRTGGKRKRKKAGGDDGELSSVTEAEGEGEGEGESECEGAKGKPRSFRSPSARPRKSKQQGTPRSTAKAKV
jgi:hypothetical protein